MAMTVQVMQLTLHILAPEGRRHGDRLGSHHDILDCLDDYDLVDHVAIGNVVGADKLVATGDRGIRWGRSRRGRRSRLGKGGDLKAVLGSSRGSLLKHAARKMRGARSARRIGDGRNGDVDSRGLGVGAAERRSRAVLNGDIARQGIANETLHLLVSDDRPRRHLALPHLILALDREDRAIGDHAALIGANVNG